MSLLSGRAGNFYAPEVTDLTHNFWGTLTVIYSTVKDSIVSLQCNNLQCNPEEVRGSFQHLVKEEGTLYEI